MSPRPCGTRAAYVRHRRHGEEPCEPCKLANAATSRALYAARSAQEPPAAPGPHQEVPGDAEPAEDGTETLLGGATVAEDAREDRWRDAAS